MRRAGGLLEVFPAPVRGGGGRICALLSQHAVLPTPAPAPIGRKQTRRTCGVDYGDRGTKVRGVRTEPTLSFNLLMSLTLRDRNHFNQHYIHFIVAVPFNSR